MASSGFMRFFKVSCLGCLGLGVLVIVSLAAVGWLRARGAEYIEAEASYAPERLVAAAALEAGADLPDAADRPVNRVNLLVTGVEKVEVRPCRQNEGLTVDATYNKKRAEFSERLVEQPDGGWVYTVEMTGSGSQITRLIEKLFSGRGASLDVCLPAQAPIELQAEVKEAGLEAELGGLWLPVLDIGFDKAGGFVNFETPLVEPAESVSVEANMAGMLLLGLGNASPASFEVDYRFGGLTVDMAGPWRQDADIGLEGSAGGLTILLPRSVRVEGVPDLEPAAGTEETAPTLFFAEGTDFESIEIKRR